MVIGWSDEDGCYLVHFPDFPEQTYRTHGDSYEEAAKNGEEVLQLLLEDDELPLPQPKPIAALANGYLDGLRLLATSQDNSWFNW
jgi:predicted RNase H-like HicB family nuclease